MERDDWRPDLRGLTTIHWLAIVLALLSAGVHLVLGIGFLPHVMGVAFLVATVGFVAGVALVLVDFRRRLVYLLGIPFTGAQIVLWYLVNRPTSLEAVGAAGAIDKVAQGLLIVLLVVLVSRDS